MAVVRTVQADASLPHQIVLRISTRSTVEVSCNCRKRRHQPAFGTVGARTLWEIFQAGPHATADGPLDRLVTGERSAYSL